ncbi:MAG TPA: ABC transporter permease [Gemmatimonadales bacterium]|nr:ABC transporter permease [Gemmatimonadales bacterium]
MSGSLLQTLARAVRTPAGAAGLLLFLAMVLVALVAPPFLPDPAAIPDAIQGAVPPGAAHPLGTDSLNRDILARLVTGARISLGIAAFATLLSLSVGTAVGMVAGYSGGVVDAVLMRVVDGAMAIPRLFILLLLVLVWDRIPLPALVLVIGVTGWFATSRLVRGEVLRLRHQPFVTAAEALGASPARVMLRHLLPNAAGPLIVTATLGVGDVILLEAGLSFLGLGIQPPTPSWGGMILDARSIMTIAPWTGIFPGLAVVLTVLSANLLGEALRAAIDPRTA